MTRRRVFLFLILALAALAVYAQSLGNGFVAWDDPGLITENRLVQAFTAGNVWGAFTSYDPELYVPLTIVSYQVEHALFGFRPFFFHLTNLILHAVASGLVFLFLRRLTIGETAAFLCALLFAVHPVNVEAVAWASARKDLLMAVFGLTSLLSYLRWREEGGRWFWITGAFLLLSLLSKPTAIVIPFAFLLLDWFSGRTVRWDAFREKAPFFILSIVFLLIGIAGKTRNIESLTLLQTFFLTAKSTVLSFSLFVFPRFSLLFLQTTPVTLSGEFLLPLLLIVVAGIAVFLTLRRTHAVAFGVGFAFLFLLPSFTGFSKAGYVSVTSDRYMYVSQIGFLFLLGMLLMPLLARRGIIRTVSVGLFAVLLCIAAWSSFQRSLFWKDSGTLFARALAENPASADLHLNLGNHYREQGMPEQAAAEYREALRLHPTLAKASFNLGLMAQQEGRTDDALAAYRAAAESDPRYAEPHNNIGSILLDRGQVDEAIREFQKAVELSPRYAQAYVNLAEAYGRKEMYEEGLAAYRKAMEIDPVFREELLRKVPALRELR